MNADTPKTCVVVGAGDFSETADSLKKSDVVIAADGGYAALAKIGVAPDWVIGDFDSSAVVPEGENVIRLPKEKDDTDMMAAVRLGLKEGCREFYLYGGTGGRFDHTVANVQTLAYLAENGARGYMIDKENVSGVIHNGTLSVTGKTGDGVSVFSLSDTAAGVTLNGLKYALTDAVLTRSFPLGVSNELVGKTGSVTVKNGTLLVVFPRGYQEENL